MTDLPIDTPPVDLDLIEADLRDVESALARLADGTYFPQPVAFEPGTDAAGLPNDPADDGPAEADSGARSDA
jgi:hypothetical protein